MATATVATYLRRWLVHIRSRVRVTTYEGYEALIRCHAIPLLGEKPLDGLNPLDLQETYAFLLDGGPQRRPLSPGSVRNLHLVLTQAFKQAVRWQLLAANPAAGAQPPRPRTSLHATTGPELLQRILDHLPGHPLELPVAIAIATGMRRGEVLALRWSDLDADYAIARIQRSLQATKSGLLFEDPKTRRSRRAVALPQFLHPYLVKQRDDQHLRIPNYPVDGLIIDGGDGEPLHPDKLSAGWRRFVKKHGLPPLRFHDLRHAHASVMLIQGVHPKIVSERLGHASIGITLDTYSHVLPSMQTEAANAFDSLFSTANARPGERTSDL